MAQLIHLFQLDKKDGMRQALHEALRHDNPQCDDLVAAGIAHYHASDLLKRLLSFKELNENGWETASRKMYLAAAQKPKHLAQMPSHEQPREKAQAQGIQSLADAELMALLLRTGNANEGVLEFAHRLVREHEGVIGLADLDIEELMQAEGLGPAKATEIAAAFELGRRLSKSKRTQRPVLRQPEDVIDLIAPDMSPLRHEELWCLALDTQSRLIGDVRCISQGDIDGTDAGPRAFFRRALQVGAASAIAVHNHPSGKPDASAADLAVTKRLHAAGKLLEVPLQDHIVIGDGGSYYSIRRRHPELFA